MQIKKSTRGKLIYLFVVLVLIGHRCYAMENKQFDIKISEEINNGLRLVIYYYPLDYLIRKPFTETAI